MAIYGYTSPKLRSWALLTTAKDGVAAIGRDARPEYFLRLKHGKAATDALTAFSRRRWLARRIENREVIEDVASHSLVYPVTHGARIPPEIITADDEDDLFS